MNLQALPSKIDFNKNNRSNARLMQQILGSNTEEIEMEIEPRINDLELLNNLPTVSFSSIKEILNKK